MSCRGLISSSQQINSHNKSKIDLSMFNICKTVKIYQTVNHYHAHQQPNHVDKHELNYSEDLLPSSQNIALKTIQIHTTSHSKNRTGISVSIKKTSRVSPRKKFHNQRHNSDLVGVSHQLPQLDQSKSKETQFNSIKLKTTNRYDNDSPLFVESKITYGETSPKIKICQPLQSNFTLPESELLSLNDYPLKREQTRTTHESLRKSQPRTDVNINPLKRSALFLRTTHSNPQQPSLKNSMCQSHFKNSIDFKLGASKIKSKDVTESLLKLSSSFSQILEKPSNQLPFDQFSRTCSLQLKKDDFSRSEKQGESVCLQHYACQVNESIILDKQHTDKELKVVKSNNELLQKQASQEFKPSLSSILERQDSPVKRLRKCYGENLLHPYDKDTIVSKSFVSGSNRSFSKRQIIDESIIIQHQIQANKFLPLKQRTMNRQFFRLYLAIQSTTRLLVSIKEVPINKIDKINNQLALYRQMESGDIGISKFYQMYTHGTSYILVKQPFQYTLHEFLERHPRQYVLMSWQFITRGIEEMLTKSISSMSKKKMILTRLISAEDIVYVFGEWKLHSPDMFSLSGAEQEPTPLIQVMEYLKQQILGRIRERQQLY